MAIEYNFTLDMDRSKRDNNIAYARTGDVDSITINADLVLNGTAYTPTGTNAFFECITPNGHSIRVAASKTGSAVSVDVPPAAFQAAGVINVAYFRFETGSSDNPTYVESTEPFAIVVREGIGDNIDTGDYIEEWRALADQLEAIVAEVEQKAEQAETAIDEQKAEVDQLKAQVQVSMAQDAEDVSDAKDTAISNINGSQGAVDAAIDKLEQKTQEAVDAAQEALDGTLATDLQNKINRTLKLDVADMVNISNDTSLSSLTAVGSYCCKTAATAVTISDSPVDDSPFNMYVFSSSTSGQVMQLVVPIDLMGKPTAEWHVRFGTSSAMDPWSVIGGGADIAAGLGIDVAGDVKKTVSLDTDAFYQHHEATDIIQGSTEVTGGGRIKELTAYGNTRQNLWSNPSGTKNSVNAIANADGSVTLSGTATAIAIIYNDAYVLRPGSTYTLSVDKKVTDAELCGFGIEWYVGGSPVSNITIGKDGNLSRTFTIPAKTQFVRMRIKVPQGVAVSGTYRVMLNEGDTAEPWCPPGLNGVDELSIVTSGKNIAKMYSGGTNNGVTTTVNDDGSITVSGTNTGAAFGAAYCVGATKDAVDAVAGREITVSLKGGVKGLYLHLNGSQPGDADNVLTGANEYNQYVGTATVPDGFVTSQLFLGVRAGFSGTVTVYPQLELGSTATAYEPPAVTSTPIDLDGHALNSLPDGTRDELHIDGTGVVMLVQKVGVATAPKDAGSWRYDASVARAFFALPSAGPTSEGDETEWLLCDKLPARKTFNDASYALVSILQGFSKNPAITSAATAATVAGGATYLYPLATQQEVELPGISMPDLASPNYIVYASSNVPAEIEAEVVKVDYLPPSDVYTKQEVDQKIEAGSMPDIVPVSKGGTGVTTAAAERNRLGLGNTTGALPIANGGTGATTVNKAFQNLHPGGIVTSVNDSDFLSAISNSGWAGKAISLYNFWTSWVVTKIRSTFGFSSSNVLPASNGGTGATSAASARTNLDVYSKAEVDGKVPKVVYGAGNIPSNAENGTIYIQYRS